mgnify:CR=1 FL=1
MTAAFAAPAFAQPSASPTLDAIKARGTLNCGVGTGVAGFALPDSRGVWQGLDADLCRGLAVAIFNDASKVRFVPLSSSTRFTALGSGEVDVLFRTSTQTMLRDTTLGLRHVTTYFYDGHGFMVKADAGVQKVAEMRGATICLIHQANYLLDRQIAALEAAFVEDGGYSAQLATERLRHRKDQSDRSDPTNPTDLQPPNCPACGSLMTLRTAKSGKTPGSQFWGCTKYPDCKGTAKI